MGDYIALDAHKRYSFGSVERNGEIVSEGRIEHRRGAIRDFLSGFEAGTPVAVEATGSWYWIVDEIEDAGMEPRLVHAGKARSLISDYNKTDRLDARGLNMLQAVGRLPVVWIPSGELRDRRELPRTRMVLTAVRTRLKNRVSSTLMKYGLSAEGSSDAFAPKGRKELKAAIARLPKQTREVTGLMLERVDALGEDVKKLEKQIAAVCGETQEIAIAKTLPGVGPVLGVVIAAEVGDVSRFRRASSLAAYSGTVPRVYSSGDKTRMGKTRPDVNRYLKWAFFEAGNVISRHRRKWPHRHVARLYERIRNRKGHAKAVGAVARHLAEATWWILSRKESYRDPAVRKVRDVNEGANAQGT